MALCLMGATSNAYAWGIAAKGGFQRLDSSQPLDKTTPARFEVEISTGDAICDHLELALSFGGSSLGTTKYEYPDPVFIGDRIEEFEDRLYDGRLTARLYPFGGAGGRDPFQLIPFVGAGVGYFHLETEWTDTYVEAIPGGTYIEEESDTERLARGFFPFVTAGVNLAVTEMAELLFEFQYDFEKRDKGWDLDGPIFFLGLRIRSR
jgi:hypothetical protein